MKKYFIAAIAFAGISLSALAQGVQRDQQFWRAPDQRGINVFETGKADTVAFE